MKAGSVEIGTLLQNRNRVCVPIYQRQYVWNREKQWEPFWRDIRTKAIERLAGRETRFSHFMGAVVLESRAKPSVRQVPSFQVVDGQQRLTTFQLFLTAARHYASVIGHRTAADTLKRYLLNSDPHLMEHPESEVFKVWPTQSNRAIFTDIVASEDRDALRRLHPDHWYKNAKRDQVNEYNPTPGMLRAYGYFYDRIRHSVESDDLIDDLAEDTIDDDGGASDDGAMPREFKLDAIWQSLLEEFKVVEIVLDEGDDAQVIFETLNDRGEPLLAADLVRNNIFQRADARGEDAERLFAAHWTPFEHPFWAEMEKQGRYKKQRIEFFLANFIAGKIAGEVTLSKLFSEYKAFLKPKRSATPRYASVADEIGDLQRHGAVYRELIERSSGSALASAATRLREWDVTTINPLLMRLWLSPMAGQDKERAFDLLLSLIVRRAVCGLTNKNYNYFFLSLIAVLDGSGWSFAALRDAVFSSLAASTRFPLDAEFDMALQTQPLYHRLGPARVRSMLSRLELHMRGSRQEMMTLPDALTIEHVLPQSWREHWPMPDGTTPSAADLYAALPATEDDTNAGPIARRRRLVQTLGNLTLVTQSFNSSVSNLGFDVKRAEFKAQSILMLNKPFSELETWSEAAIEARGRDLAARAVAIWRSDF